MGSRFGIAGSMLIFAALAGEAQAIAINEHMFETLGGTLADPAGSMATVAARLHARSLQPQFLGVGRLTVADSEHRCTATWLGEDDAHAFILTAAHCVANEFRTGPWVRRIGRVTLVNDALRLHGEATAFLAPVAVTPGSTLTERDRGDSDVALVRVRSHHGWSVTGTAPAPPLLDDVEGGAADLALAGGATTQFVGYGDWHVGTRPLDADGRLWASSLGGVTGQARQLFTVRYQATGSTDRWFSGTSGDSGGAFWQPVAGYWRIVGVERARDTGWAGSEGPRLAAIVHWLKGVFPGARTVSDRLSVKADAPFVSRDHAADVSRGSVVYTLPSQPEVSGPAAMQSSGVSGYSLIRAVVEEALTHQRVEIILRARRETGCGWSARMEDPVTCGTSAPARLTVSFHAEDNPELERGSYAGRIEVEAVGSEDAAYRQRFPLYLQIDYQVQGQVTATRAYQSPDLRSSLSPGSEAPLRFVLPAQPWAQWQGNRTEGGGAFSRVRVTVTDVLENRERTLVLRAQRSTGAGACPAVAMQATTDCGHRPLADGLRLEFVKDDNRDLPAGIYRGRVFLQVRGSGEASRTEQIGVDVAIRTI